MLLALDPMNPVYLFPLSSKFIRHTSLFSFFDINLPDLFPSFGVVICQPLVKESCFSITVLCLVDATRLSWFFCLGECKAP